jgi:hypothetical protein
MSQNVAPEIGPFIWNRTSLESSHNVKPPMGMEQLVAVAVEFES